MKKGKKWRFFSSVLLIIGILGSTGCADAGGASSILTIGVRDDIVNFGYYNETTDNYYGLEIDIAEEMADRMGYEEVEFVPVVPENRKEKLLNGEVDCIVAAYSISEQREKNFDFSPPYYTDELIIMVQKSALFHTIRDLKGKTIGIVNGTDAGPLIGETLYKEGIITDEVVADTDEYTEYSDAKVLKAGTYAQLSDMLETGEIDAACLDACLADTYTNDDREYLDYVLREQNFGVATQKGSELSGQVSETIQEMLDDGTIDKIIGKWK